ncbi:TadE/TadG family type IV pilus assembly protein [Variovorax sp. Varisp62]|uniref:TadE/TadG family type IV pilus assembly protein n=1 Tax=Variovorax sp. Varisp62 TaxID=3243049 RepID=UPI0039B38B23
MSVTSIRLRTSPPALRLQRGIAAIEFAFVFIFLFLVMYGLVTFGAIFYTQQAVSRAAEDGARAAVLLPQPPDQESVRQVVLDSLARSLVVPISANTDTASRKNWLSANVTVAPCSAAPGATSCVVTVTYLYKNNRILPSVSLLDSSWVPDNLRSSATAALKAS